MKILINHKTIATILFCFFLTSLWGQSPYKLNSKKYWVSIGLGIGTELITEGIIIANIEPHSLDELAQLTPNKVNSFDRMAISNYSAKSRTQSDILLISSYTYPLFLLLDKNIRKDYLTVGGIGLEVLIWNTALTGLTKGLVRRTRPFVYNPEVPLFEKTDFISTRLSFFSGHTSNVAALSFFTAKVLTDYYPDSKWKPLIWSAAALLPATTGYLRVKGGKHFPTDVITGFAVGAMVGILIPQLHKKKTNGKEEKINLSLQPSGTSLGLVLTW